MLLTVIINVEVCLRVGFREEGERTPQSLKLIVKTASVHVRNAYPANTALSYHHPVIGESEQSL